MEVGIKLWSRDHTALADCGFADFIEVMPVPGVSLERFKSYDYKYAIHAPHSEFGLNLADPKLEKKNMELLSLAVKAADELNADVIVVHTGFTSDKLKIKNPVENINAFFKKFRDERFHVENLLAAEASRVYSGKTPEELTEITAPFGFKFCFDFGHAIGAANTKGIDYKKLVDAFLKLKPDYFHLSGTNLDKEVDGHLSLFDGNLDISWAKKIIAKRNRPVCLETPLNIEQRKKEVKLLKG